MYKYGMYDIQTKTNSSNGTVSHLVCSLTKQMKIIRFDCRKTKRYKHKIQTLEKIAME